MSKLKIIACATVIEEMLPILPPDIPYDALDFGLHLRPEGLKTALQQAIDQASDQADTIILGYGLCAMAVVGLRATNCTLIIPHVDDCIAIFLGSREAYEYQSGQTPGTYYLTKGWIEVNDTPFEEHKRLVERYGVERADRMMQLMLKHYTRLAFIDTGQQNQEHYRAYAREAAAKFNLKYEEIPGSNRLIKKMIWGPWDDEDFVIAQPGQIVTYADFKTTVTTTGNLITFSPDNNG